MSIALFVQDSWIRPIGGDFLVVIFLYFAMRAVVSTSRILTATSVFLFAAGVEISSALDLVERLGLSGNKLAEVTLGATFDPLDFAAYALGIILAVALDRP